MQIKNLISILIYCSIVAYFTAIGVLEIKQLHQQKVEIVQDEQPKPKLNIINPMKDKYDT